MILLVSLSTPPLLLVEMSYKLPVLKNTRMHHLKYNFRLELVVKAVNWKKFLHVAAKNLHVILVPTVLELVLSYQHLSQRDKMALKLSEEPTARQ